MGKRAILIKEIEKIPEPYIDEVLDFVKFLRSKKLKGIMETALLSESALKKDWMKPEEDRAWKDL